MKVTAMFFSPCGSTKECACKVAETLSDSYTVDSFTLPEERINERIFGKDDVLVIGSPTYAGKLPNKIMPDFKEKIKANGTKAIAIVTYGNRAYENSLAELVAILKNNGFDVCAAAALVNEHSMVHIAQGRPNAHDLEEIADFAKKIDLESNVSVPGDADAPYYVPKQENGEPAKFLPAKPKTDMDKCVKCGVCAASCPMGSISRGDFSLVEGICIKCHACVNKCQANAKYFDDEQLLSHLRMIGNNFADEKKNEYFV